MGFPTNLDLWMVTLTTIAFRNGIMAADTQETWGDNKFLTVEKIFIRTLGTKARPRDVLFGTAGGSYAGMAYVDWYGSPKTMPAFFRDLSDDEDFSILIWDRNKLFVVNWMCIKVEVAEPFYAIGSGAAAALGAMHMGATAVEAVEAAMKVDAHTGGTVTYYGPIGKKK